MVKGTFKKSSLHGPVFIKAHKELGVVEHVHNPGYWRMSQEDHDSVFFPFGDRVS